MLKGVQAAKPTLTASTGRTWQMVGTRCGLNGLGGVYTGPGMVQRTKHWLPVGAREVAACFAGFYMTSAAGVVAENGYKPGLTGTAYKVVGAVPALGGSGYAVGDTVVPATNANDVAPTLCVLAVTGGVVTSLGVAEGGLLVQGQPSTNIAQTSTSGSGTGLKVNLAVEPYATGFDVGLEPAWGTQTAYSDTNLTGVKSAPCGKFQTGAGRHAFLPSGDTVATDFVPIAAAAGATLGVRLSHGGQFWTGRYLSTSAGLNEYLSYLDYTDYASGGTMPSGSDNPLLGMQPLALIGSVEYPTPTWIIVGDSITRGYAGSGATGATVGYDDGDAAKNIGWAERALAAKWPWSNFSTDSDRLAYWIGTSAKLRLAAIEYLRPTHVLDTMGANDVGTGAASYATLRAQKIAFWAQLKALGVKKIWAATLMPQTTSTDGWATVENQTVTAANTAIQAWNADLRANYQSLGCDHLLDLALLVESSAASGKWPEGGTVDGIHPTPAIHIAIAAAFSAEFAAVNLA